MGVVGGASGNPITEGIVVTASSVFFEAVKNLSKQDTSEKTDWEALKIHWETHGMAEALAMPFLWEGHTPDTKGLNAKKFPTISKEEAALLFDGDKPKPWVEISTTSDPNVGAALVKYQGSQAYRMSVQKYANEIEAALNQWKQ
jgi:hypothetical protein